MVEDSLKIVLEDSRDFVKIIDYYSEINTNKQAAILVGICGFRLNMSRSVPKYRDHLENIAESALYDIDYNIIKDKNNLFNKLLNAEIINIEEIKRILDYYE
ncbi:MAG: hypothetical protein ACOYPR_21895 [Saprospiraceae bacterium]